MKNRIENLEDLRSEILRLKLQRFQQEAVLQQDTQKFIDKFSGPIHAWNKINAWFGSGNGKNKDINPAHEEHDWLTNTLRLGLPVVLNKLLFPRSGFIIKTVVALLSQNVAKSVNKDVVTSWIDKTADWIKHYKNNKTQKPKHSDYGIPPDSETY